MIGLAFHWESHTAQHLALWHAICRDFKVSLAYILDPDGKAKWGGSGELAAKIYRRPEEFYQETAGDTKVLLVPPSHGVDVMLGPAYMHPEHAIYLVGNDASRPNGLRWEERGGVDRVGIPMTEGHATYAVLAAAIVLADRFAKGDT